MPAATAVDYQALVQPDRVHGSLYTDPRIFAEELERIFYQGWVYVGHAGEVPKAGDLCAKRIGLQPVVMVRDRAGAVNLFINRCRHRGAQLCVEERANVPALRCPYHGWTYRLDGSLSGVPFPDAYEGTGFHRDEMGLIKVPRVEQYRGFVFASLAPTGITLAQHLGRAAEQIDRFVAFSSGEEVLVDGGASKYDLRANWKLPIENAVDGYHAITLHASYIGLLEERARVAGAADNYKGQFAGSQFAATRDLGGGHVMLDYWSRMYDALNGEPLPEIRPTTAAGQQHFEELIGRFGRERTEHSLTQGFTHTVIFPNIALIGVQIRVIQPVTPDYTEVAAYPTRLNWLSEEVNAARLRGHEAFFGPASFGAPDDLEILERVQKGLAADRLDPWLRFYRGMARERRDVDGTTLAARTDELTQRGIWRQWLKLMSQRPARRARMVKSAGSGTTEQAAQQARGRRHDD
jgi:phenylpropionate dioxygenase-like ring-hydroxylating dioxygenase large terminal subunit